VCIRGAWSSEHIKLVREISAADDAEASKFEQGKGETRDDVGEAGMETDEAGWMGSEGEAPALQDTNDLFRTRGVDEGAGARVGEGAGIDAVHRSSITSGSGYDATISRWVVPSRR
jgi:hypothetical protein